MKYDCGHGGCDICGVSECARPESPLRNYRHGRLNFLVCDSCISLAIKFAYDACCIFGGTIIDVTRPCGAVFK